MLLARGAVVSRKGKQERTVATCRKCGQPFVTVVRRMLGGDKTYHESRCATCRCLASAASHEDAAVRMRAKASVERVRTARAVKKFREVHGGKHCGKCAVGGSCSILDVGP